LQSDAFKLSTELRYSKTLRTQKLYLNKKPLERIINHCANTEEIDAVKYILSRTDELKYIRTRLLGDCKDVTSGKDAKNIQLKRERGVKEYIEYEFTYNGWKWLIGMERHRSNFEQPYYIHKK
jgi:hypothetical protein